MFDYKKLFAVGNVVGIKFNKQKVIVCSVDFRGIEECFMPIYANSTLSTIDSYGVPYEIEYIVRLDDHGNVVEHLFDRERDMK